MWVVRSERDLRWNLLAGTALVAHWLRISASSTSPSLARELRSHTPGNTAKRIKQNKTKHLSYSDPTGQNSLQGTAGCGPDWNISSQTRSPPPLLCSLFGRGWLPDLRGPLISPQVSSVGDAGLRQNWASRRLPSGFSCLSSASVETTVSTFPGGLITTRSTQPQEANTVSFPSPAPGARGRGRLAAGTGRSGYFWSRKGPPEGAYTWAACGFRGGDSRSHRDPRSRRVRSPPWGRSRCRDRNTPTVVPKAPRSTSL